MIVVDSSVWISQLRKLDRGPVHMLRDIRNHEQILVGDLIMLEVLQGTRDEAHAARVERDLRRFPIATMLDDNLAVKAAANYRLLRGKGITIRKTIDIIIATFCIEKEHMLLHDDRDFSAMATHLGLRLA